MSYTKLFNSIISSTIWTEDDQTRIVWITLMAMADKNGEIQGSIPGIARLAGVSLESTEKAFDKFLSPDPYSRTKDEEGRRLEEIDGGWAMINHAKYRQMASKEDQKQKNADRQRRFKAKQKNAAKSKKSNASVTGGNALVTQDRDIADTEADTEIVSEAKASSCPRVDEKAVLSELWDNSPAKAKNRSSKKKVLEAWRKVKANERPDHEELIEAIKAWSNSSDWKKDGGQFVPGLHIWIKDQKWESLPEAPKKSGYGKTLTPDML